MNGKRIALGLLIAVTALLSGCNMRTIDQMYCLPKRSEYYLNLQAAMDSTMDGLQFHAPVSGDNQQPVQLVDLDGDGNDECIVFAKGSGEKPLKILIYTRIDDEYILVDTLAENGAAFDQVQYVTFSKNKGYDLVVGRQVSEQVVKPVSVYTMVDGKMIQLLATQYACFTVTDLDENGWSDLMILRPGGDSAQNGVAELFSMRNGNIERSQEATMSEPADRIKRVITSRLNDGTPAVYVASDVDGSAIITDVYCLIDNTFTNISLSNETGTSVETLRNYYVYADDVDSDGIIELPELILPLALDNNAFESQYIIRWYAMNRDGSEVDKLYTYHSFTGGWFLELPRQIALCTNVTQFGNSYEFSVVDEQGNQSKLMTLYAFTGQDREEQTVVDNRFVLYRNESTIYAAHLEVASAAYNMTQESVKNSFHLITQGSINADM